MIRISALNEASEEDSNSEEEVTREALEQIAFQQYAKALEMQSKGKLAAATQLLKDLLDTELLYDIKKPTKGEVVSSQLFNLKYLCYKNLAAMLSEAGDTDAAIESYSAAADLDDTDVTLWHQLGQLCMKTKRYLRALDAFQSGTECNPRHWPCLDKMITLLMGLELKEDCIVTIYEALHLDPDYLRGLVYRKHIYTTYPSFRDFMVYLNPKYKWNESEDDVIDEVEAQKLLKEANEIHETYIEQLKAEQFEYKLYSMKLNKPISEYSWYSVGDSLVHLHEYMTEFCYSHASPIELVFKKEKKEEPMDICEELKKSDNTENKTEEVITDVEKTTENGSENENNDMSDKDKGATDTEKVESDIEMVPAEPTQCDVALEPKPQKKAPARRRGCPLRSLEQWEWCKERRSVRKKSANKQERIDDNIYDTLRRMVPINLSYGNVEKKENETRALSPNIANLDKLFEESDQNEIKDSEAYFNTDKEQSDVEKFINKYTENKHDIIDILKEYLSILADKWRYKWPEGLSNIFIKANKCYTHHIDIPSCTNDNKNEILHYTTVNLMVEELSVNEKFCANLEDSDMYDLSVIESIQFMLTQNPNFFVSTQCLEFTLRYLWIKLHMHLLNKCDYLALDCLYQLSYEFDALTEYKETYSLDVPNFLFKPAINNTEIIAYVKFLERNEKLSTVMDLYERENYEEVLTILLDSFEHCKNMARKQEEEMSLNFSVQLTMILDTFWALGKVDDCFRWCLICLHEALKHFFHFTSGSPDYEKWTHAVVKILCSMEHILTREGLTCLDGISQKELSQGLEDLVRIIGHQVETSSSDMPFGTVDPWIIMHYILQREEDQGRGRTIDNKDNTDGDEIPNPLMLLFLAHELLGDKKWCCTNDRKLLYFILDTVVPRLRSPSLSKCLEQICQYMEQCVYCLFGYHVRKNKQKFLVDHNATPHPLDWKRAQQVYEIFRPLDLPALEGKISSITVDTEQLFISILQQLPAECNPTKYLPEIEKYIKGSEEKLPSIPALLPYKMRDIYFLLGDYYFKKDDGKSAIIYNMMDVIVNRDRLESWARISLAKVVNLVRNVNSCRDINNERDFLNPAKSIIKCFKTALELNPSHSTVWVEYGNFVYTVHSFCSRLLKQASESLSMEDFESLEKQKEDMLDTTQKCFTTVVDILKTRVISDDVSDDGDEETWLNFYMLGKVAEKRSKPPSVYLDYYLKSVKSLQETSATYPSKINCNAPTHQCIEVLELHYRIHASILKYIEQHENKPIPASVGKVFSNCIEDWNNGPFAKKPKSDGAVETENEPKSAEPAIQAANILKRSISDAGEEDTHEAKKLKLESAAAKVRRSASYDNDTISGKDVNQVQNANIDPNKNDLPKVIEIDPKKNEAILETAISEAKKSVTATQQVEEDNCTKVKPKTDDDNKNETAKNDESSCTSSSSSSASSSSDSSSDSSSSSSRNSDTTSKSSDDSKPLTDDEIMKIVSACLNALEDCASRFPPHYKAIYRLAHYHFYFKKGKDIERCRDLMLSTLTMRSGQKLAGLFNDRKPSNFFNNIWKIPIDEVDRTGSFAFHMNRCVLLTMEILKEIDDYKTLLELSLNLQRTPDLDKKYLRDSDRQELAQQAYSLCVQSLKGQLIKFSQQEDLKTNEVERQALRCLMVDIYKAYQKVQRQPNSKLLTNLLIDGYKLVNTAPIAENTNLVDLSLKYCYSLKQQAGMDKSHNAQKKQTAKVADNTKHSFPAITCQPRIETKTSLPTTTLAPSLPKMSHDVATALQILTDPLLQQAAGMSYLSNMSALASYSSIHNALQSTMQSSLQTSLQNSMQKSFQAEFYRQFLNPSNVFSSYNPPPPPPKKQKRGPKPQKLSVVTAAAPKSSKSFTAMAQSSGKPTPAAATVHKSNSAPLTPSMGTVLSTLPPSMSAMSSLGGGHSTAHSSQPAQAHMSTASTVSASIHAKPPLPHQNANPGKTLQEKLAERQKGLPPASKVSSDINASIGRLPSSLTITKTNVPKPAPGQTNKADAKKTMPFNEDDVIVLDDD